MTRRHNIHLFINRLREANARCNAGELLSCLKGMEGCSDWLRHRNDGGRLLVSSGPFLCFLTNDKLYSCHMLTLPNLS